MNEGIIEVQDIIPGSDTLLEEVYNWDEIREIEKNIDLIRLEMNTIEFPIFSKNRKVPTGVGKKYIFSSCGEKYLEVVPTVDHKIPGEFEERVFLGLMKLLRKSDYKTIVYTTFSTLMRESGIKYSGVYLEKTKSAVERMANCSYRFKNLFYSNDKRTVLEDRVVTKILEYRLISMRHANDEESSYFKDKRTKEVLRIDFSSLFYENIIRKGYLYFDSETLLKLDNSITRNIYTMLTKWRNKELYVKKYSAFMASRIPLSWEKKNVSQTITIIKRSMDQLKEEGLVKDYVFNKNKKLQNSYFEIYFESKHNKNLLSLHNFEKKHRKVPEENIKKINEIIKNTDENLKLRESGIEQLKKIREGIKGGSK